MSLLTRTILLLTVVVLSISLAYGLAKHQSREVSPVDRGVHARNVNRAYSYATIALQGGRVADTASERISDSDQLTSEGNEAATVAQADSLNEQVVQAYAAAKAQATTDISALDAEIAAKRAQLNALSGEVGIKSNALVGFADEVRALAAQGNALLPLVRATVEQVFKVDLDYYDSVAQTVPQMLEHAQVIADAGRLTHQTRALEDAAAQAAREYSQLTLLTAAYDSYDPMLRAKVERVGRPWARGVVVWASEDNRIGRLKLSIGSQEGLAVGQKLSVHRNGDFVARVVIESVERNSAIARLESEFRGFATVLPSDQVRGVPNFGQFNR